MPLRRRVQALGRRYPLALVVLGACLYSTGPVMVQASSLTGPVFSFWRLWIGAGVLSGAALVQRRTLGTRTPARAWRWAIAAGLAFALHQVLFMTAVTWTSVTDVTLMGTLSPIVIGLAAGRMFGERPGVGFRLWTLVAMAGAGIVILGASSGPEGDALGMLLAAGNVVAFSAFFLLSKRSRDHLDVLPFLVGVMTTAALAVSVFVLLAGQPVGAATTRDLLLTAFVAIGPGALGHFVMTWPLRWIAANIPPVIRLGQPVLAGLLAWWWLGEPVTGFHALGGGLTLVGVAGALLSRRGVSSIAPADEHPDVFPRREAAPAAGGR